MTDLILTLNAGSSSIRLALHDAAAEAPERARATVEGIGAAARLVAAAGGERLADAPVPAARDHAGALATALGLLSARVPGARIVAVGHRIVHGGTAHAAPCRLDAAALAALERLVPFAPLHQPHNLAGVRAAAAAFPEAVQVGAFDTAFHRTQARVDETFALPDAWYDKGIRRYGFHGLSYAFVADRLAALSPGLAAGRVVIAHLGNGASVCGLRGGRSVGCSMGFSPLEGLPMGTRTGQIDPAVILYMIEAEGMEPAAVADLLYRRSGLLGLSGLSNDMRRLEAAGTEAAARAIHHFVRRTAREIAAMAALTGGLDALVFTGGIGEHAVAVRGRIVEALGWLGLVPDPARNAAPVPEITRAGSPVPALVIPTDEERTIARAVRAVLAG